MDSTDDTPPEARILASWRTNAEPWAAAVRAGTIRSRAQVTDRAIVEAVLSTSPRSVLDLGCGEGWLSRVLEDHGLSVYGVDAVSALLDAARAARPGDYRCLSYRDIVDGRLDVYVDAVVCNFSLFGAESVEHLLQSLPAMLTTGGSLVVQTLHPLTVCGVLPYEDGWREGSWEGFGPAFTDPPPWYFRTVEGWLSLLEHCGFATPSVLEPTDPDTDRPASLILISAKL